jgi:hypothetical protein
MIYTKNGFAYLACYRSSLSLRLVHKAIVIHVILISDVDTAVGAGLVSLVPLLLQGVHTIQLRGRFLDHFGAAAA